jgi:AraC family transcriptional regulator, arabinose operon regulatory protein
MISITGNSINNWDDNGVENTDDPVFVTSCGYQKFITRNIRFARDHGRVDYQIIYLLKGKGYYNFGKGTVEIPEGNLIVYIPGQPQNYEYHFKDSTELYWLHFSGYAARELLAKSNFLDKQVYYIGMLSSCIELFKKIINEVQIKKPLYQSIASSNLTELFCILSRELSDRIPKNFDIPNDSFKNIAFYMYSNYNRKIKVEELAGICNLSLHRFTHKFKDLIGMTPVECLTKIRIDEAKYLLSNSFLNISEISSIVGYDNPLYFSRVFKKVTGLSPRNYIV